jgi:hypothetical protein
MIHALARYVDEVLRPRTGENRQLQAKVDSVTATIQHNSRLFLREIRPGGSFAKGTMLRHTLEADVVLIFDKTLGKAPKWGALMDQVFVDLTHAFPNATVGRGAHIALHIGFEQKDGSQIDIDVVPSFLVNSPKQMASVKTSKIYVGATTIWQVEYVRHMKALFPGYCDTVMLLKDRRDENDVPLKSFHLELLAASGLDCRGNDSRDIGLNLISGFREIQGFADGTAVYPVDWDYFDDSDIPDDFGDYCTLVDPANPRDNLARDFRKREIQIIRSEASRAISIVEECRYAELFDPENDLDFDFN